MNNTTAPRLMTPNEIKKVRVVLPGGGYEVHWGMASRTPGTTEWNMASRATCGSTARSGMAKETDNEVTCSKCLKSK